MQLMNPEHPKWTEFYKSLSRMWPEGLPCMDGEHIMNAVEVTLIDDFGFTPEEITASLEWFKSHGAPCDCQVLMKLGPAVMESLGGIMAWLSKLNARLDIVEKES